MMLVNVHVIKMHRIHQLNNYIWGHIVNYVDPIDMDIQHVNVSHTREEMRRTRDHNDHGICIYVSMASHLDIKLCTRCGVVCVLYHTMSCHVMSYHVCHVMYVQIVMPPLPVVDKVNVIRSMVSYNIHMFYVMCVCDMFIMCDVFLM